MKMNEGAFKTREPFRKFNRANVSVFLEKLFTSTERYCYCAEYCSLALNNFTAYLSLERWLKVFPYYIDKVSIP